LSAKGYETFLPTYQRRQKKWGRPQDVDAPVFPGYIFCRFEFDRRLPILMTPGIVHIVGARGTPLPVLEEELEAVRRIVNAGVGAQACPHLQVGQRVRINAGPLAGIEGILTNVRGGQRLVVSISLLQRSVAAVIDGDAVQVLPTRTAVAGQR
jgi:transcription antitermination factor NusG